MEKTKEVKQYLNYLKKLQVLKYAKARGNNKEAYEFFDIKKVHFTNGKRKA